MSTLYSASKPLWHTSVLNELRAGRRPAPVHVQLILSDLCNQDCSFCAYRMSNGLSTELFGTPETHNPNRRIPTEKALEIIDDCAALGVKAIQFTGGGEPTVHPDHLAIFDRAQQHGIETALVTNGVKLNAFDPAILKMKWIRISVDAGTAETYGRIRRVSKTHWYRVWANIEKLKENYRGKVGIGFVVTPENYREVGICAEKAAQCADNLRIGAVFSAEGRAFYGSLEGAILSELHRVRERFVDRSLEIIDLFQRRMNDLECGSPLHRFCGYQYFTLYIGGDLGLYRCCNTAYTLDGKIGSLEHQSLAEFYADRSLDDFDARGCRYCQFLAQNDAIASLMDEPDHANFV